MGDRFYHRYAPRSHDSVQGDVGQSGPIIPPHQ